VIRIHELDNEETHEMRTSLRLIVAATAGVLAFAAPAFAKDEAGVKVGTLTCNVESGWGFVFGSSKDMNCSYAPDKGKAVRYTGTINKYGVDVGYAEGGVMIWVVVAPTSDIGPDALEGDYAGATAGAAVGVGGSANALVGGLDKSIALQPLSLEGHKGLNLAAGIASIELKYVKR
jgi:hypothetical protein